MTKEYAGFKALAAMALSVAGLRLLRKYVLAGRRLPEVVRAQDLSGRVVLITGANDGLGKATAKIMAAMGATVVFACRNEAKARAAIEETLSYAASIRRERVQYIHLDLADLASVRACAETFRATHTRLDVLVNNAGVGITSALGVTQDGFETVFQVNYLGHFYLTYLLRDLIVQCGARVVNVSSFGHRLCRDAACFSDVRRAHSGLRARYFLYGRSKLANILFTRELQKRLKAASPQFAGDVFAVNPGRVHTGAWGKMFPAWLKPFFAILGWLTMKTPLEGAATTVFCAVAPDLRGQGGAYFSNCAVATPSPLALDDDLAQALWAAGERLLDVTFDGSG